MIEQELIKKVGDHLIESNSIFVENSIVLKNLIQEIDAIILGYPLESLDV